MFSNTNAQYVLSYNVKYFVFFNATINIIKLNFGNFFNYKTLLSLFFSCILISLK